MADKKNSPSSEKSAPPTHQNQIMADLSINAVDVGLESSPRISTLDRPTNVGPPSFAQSEFETIVRRQKNKHPQGLKVVDIPSRFPHLDNKWEFAGWGTMSYLEITDEELLKADARISQRPRTVGQLRGTSLPGNSMTSSVFYAFPAVVAVSSIFSPISLFVACLILFLWRPIFLELGSAIHLNGGNYQYLLQVSGKTMGLVGAAATLLDSVATSTVSAATAASYLRGEFGDLPISDSVIAIVVLTGLAFLCFLNVRSSSALALVFFLTHFVTMSMLMIACVVAWARRGSGVLESNWDLRPRGASHVARAIFDGVCIGFLGVTGFETTPIYIESIRANIFSSVLRNILICTLVLNAPLILLVYAILPSEAILAGANILSVLAESVAGRWMRVLVVVDCVFVLSGGVIDGICSGCALIERLARDRVFAQILLKRLPITGAPWLSIVFCFVLNILLYASSGFNLATISGVFTVCFLFVLLLFVVSNILLKFNRDRLPRSRKTGILTVFLTFAVAIILLVGNIVQDPKILGLFAIYFLVTLLPLLAMRTQTQIGRILIWLYDQFELHTFRWTEGWEAKIVRGINKTRKSPICVWVRRDDIHNLVDIILYIRNNENTGRIIFVHAYQQIEAIPAELPPNIKIVDEAFPPTTIDLVFVRGKFGPPLVEAVSETLDVPRSQMFFSCPGKDHGWELADYQGVRVVNF